MLCNVSAARMLSLVWPWMNRALGFKGTVQHGGCSVVFILCAAAASRLPFFFLSFFYRLFFLIPNALSAGPLLTPRRGSDLVGDFTAGLSSLLAVGARSPAGASLFSARLRLAQLTRELSSWGSRRWHKWQCGSHSDSKIACKCVTYSSKLKTVNNISNKMSRKTDVNIGILKWQLKVDHFLWARALLWNLHHGRTKTFYLYSISQ